MRASDEVEAILLVDNERQVWRELLWLQYENQWSPKWAMATYKELYGEWPDGWMYDLKPDMPSTEMRKMITRRINKWKREMRKRYANKGDTKISGGVRVARAGARSKGTAVDGYIRPGRGED